MQKRLLLLAPLLALASIASPLPGGTPAAQANGGGAFQFVATGTLPRYPTNGDIVPTTMSGSLTGNAQITGTVGTRVYTANLTLKTATFTNQPIQYQVEPFPYCLAASQAAGNLTKPYDGTISVDTVAPAVAGQVYVSGDTVLGGIYRTVINFKFTYQRVTAGTVVVVNPGTITVYWRNVNGTSGSFSQAFTGAGPGVVQYTDPVAANSACINDSPRPVGFAVTGNIEAAGA